MPGFPAARDVTLQVADAIGGLMEFWGFKRNLGRMWTILYLSPEPMAAAEISERLTLSTGAVSMLLSELLQWGAVKKSWVPGERRDYYEAETSIWKMVSRVFRERELLQIRNSIETFERASEALRGRIAAPEDDGDRRLSVALERIDGLLALARIGERLLEGVLSGQSVDASPLALFDAGDRKREPEPGEG